MVLPFERNDRHCFGDMDSRVGSRWCRLRVLLRAEGRRPIHYALGASEIYMGEFAELGPLDVQYSDPDREERMSALDEVHVLDRVHAFALKALDETVILMMSRTRKKSEVILPLCMEFTTKLVAPMLQNVDVVHHTAVARMLKVAEEYAVRIMAPHQLDKRAEAIASALVETYPDHGFLIDREEAKKLGLPIQTVNDQLEDVLRMLADVLRREERSILGALTEVKP